MVEGTFRRDRRAGGEMEANQAWRESEEGECVCIWDGVWRGGSDYLLLR